jgi:Tfp pilus assembly protein PilO
MSQAFTRILDNQSNKLLANIPSMDLNVSAPVVQPIPLQVQSAPLQVQLAPQIDDLQQECKAIKLFGYEFTIYTLILIVVLVVCVGYFLYKYFFTKTDLVVYKKNPKKELKKNKSKNKEEFSNVSEVSNMSDSSSVQTLDI